MNNQQEPHTLCTKCNNFIRTANFLIHDARCQGPTNNNQSPMRNSRIFNTSRYSNSGTGNNSWNNNSGNRGGMQRNQVQEERISCHFCGYGQTLMQLDTHPQKCQHRQQKCPKCNVNFPRSLMQQHTMVCPANRPPNYPPNYNPNSQSPWRQRQPMDRRSQRERYQQQMAQQYQHARMRYQQQMAQQYQHARMRQMQQRRQLQNDPLRMIDMIFNNFMQPSSIRNRNYNEGYEPGPNQPARQRPSQMSGLIQLIHMMAGRGIGPQQQGLSKQQIKKFPVSKFKAKPKKQGEDNDMCIICYCAFEDGEDMLTLPCKHIFHPECVGTWLQKNPTCPVCKHNFGPERHPQQQQVMPGRGFIRVIRFP